MYLYALVDSKTNKSFYNSRSRVNKGSETEERALQLGIKRVIALGLDIKDVDVMIYLRGPYHVFPTQLHTIIKGKVVFN